MVVSDGVLTSLGRLLWVFLGTVTVPEWKMRFRENAENTALAAIETFEVGVSTPVLDTAFCQLCDWRLNPPIQNRSGKIGRSLKGRLASLKHRILPDRQNRKGRMRSNL